MTKRALVVRGGWDGHQPIQSTDLFLPFLQEQGYETRIESSPAIYADSDVMAGIDVIVQSVTMSKIEGPELDGLRAAVASGTGMTGWHGGIADSFRESSDYLQLIGGQFATHPAKHPDDVVGGKAEDNFLRYVVEMTDLGREHPITRGIPDFELETEQYWVLTDDLIDVLATTTHPAPPWHPWHRPVVSPVVWTRHWGRGRIAVATPGHSPDVLEDEHVRTIIERSILWVTRTASES